jgi:hypothetical protein
MAINKVIMTAKVASQPYQEQDRTYFRIQHRKDYFSVIATGNVAEPASTLNRGDLIEMDGSLRNQFIGDVDGKRTYQAVIYLHFFSQNNTERI